MRVRRAALAGDRVDALDVLRAQVVERLGDEADAFVLPHPGPQELVELLVGGVDHRAAWVSSRISSVVLIRRASRKTCWPSTTSMPCRLQRGQHGSSMTSTPSGSSASPNSSSSRLILRATSSAMPGVRVEGAAQRRDAGAGAARVAGVGAVVRCVRISVDAPVVVEPRVVQLVVLGRRAEVPHDRVAAAGQQGEPDQLVDRPRADVGGGHVADVGEVEGQHSAELGAFELRA